MRRDMPANYPKVTIVTPLYNRALVVQRTIKSVLNQTYQNWEMILVDDGSDHNPEEIIRSKYGNESRILFINRNRDDPGRGRPVKGQEQQTDVTAIQHSLPIFIFIRTLLFVNIKNITEKRVI